MDLLINAIADIVKHMSHSYVNTGDNTLNIKVIALTSILIGIISKAIMSLFNVNFYKYMQWYISYKIFNKKTLIYPMSSGYYTTYCNVMYMPDPKVNDYKFYQIEIVDNDVKCYFKSLKIDLFEKSYGDKLYDSYRNYTNTTSFKDKDVNREYAVGYFKHVMISSHASGNYMGKYIIGYFNGYYIYVQSFQYSETLTFECTDKVTLNEFMYIIEKKIKTANENGANKSTNLDVVEYVKKEFISYGAVKPALVMDNYVSRYKKQLIKQLNSFKSGKLYENNPYIENNLGIMLHGTYGTGKSFLMSVIANYLQRSICNVNFTKIKTKSEFREVMNKANCNKYVYCFDEFDYILADMLDNGAADIKQDVQLKIMALNAQLSAVKDNKEASGKIIGELKQLMEEGTSDALTYQFILSELSGITSVNGRIIIATTNFIDRIPKALLRPGRFDCVLHLSYFNTDEIRELLCKLYGAESETIVNKYVFPEDKFTPSEIILKHRECVSVEDMIAALDGTIFGVT